MPKSHFKHHQTVSFNTVVTSIYCVFLVPDEHPTGFTASDITSTSISISWNPVSGNIVMYVINVTVQETGEHFQWTSTTTSYEATGLKPFRTYVCIIAAATTAGLGPPAPAVDITTLEDGKSFLM